MNSAKLKRFNIHLQNFIEALDQIHEVDLHHSISQFYYMQKVEELRIMQENVDLARLAFECAESSLEANYREVFCNWKRDARALALYRAKAHRCDQFKSD